MNVTYFSFIGNAPMMVARAQMASIVLGIDVQDLPTFVQDKCGESVSRKKDQA